MRILLVHNFYGSSAPSGENRAVEVEKDLLRCSGHEVIEHFRHSDTIRDRGLLPVLRAAPFIPWNPAERTRLQRVLGECDPDIMHVHNVFPLLSPAIFSAAAGKRTAVVFTLHNYRTVCPAGIPLRMGQVCTSCIDTRSVRPALKYGCYRNSRLATIPIAASVALHRTLRTYARQVDALIALTQFQKSVLTSGGLPEQLIHVKPNCYSGIAHPVPWDDREAKAVFLGRLSQEKGIDTLVRGWLQLGPVAPKLEIIGDGPEWERLRTAVQAAGSDRIIFAGRKTPEETHALLAKAKLLLLPSEWFEGFPLVLCEAFAFGVPVVASRLGPFEELVERAGAGKLFTPKDPASLKETVAAVWREEPKLREMSGIARQQFETKYTAQRSMAMLESIYQAATVNKRQRLRTA